MNDMLPKTPEEAIGTMVHMVLLRAYQDLAVAAVKKRLTEHDISVIQRNALDVLRELDAAADEFSTFELEPAIANARQALRILFDNCAADRRGNRPL